MKQDSITELRTPKGKLLEIFTLASLSLEDLTFSGYPQAGMQHRRMTNLKSHRGALELIIHQFNPARKLSYRATIVDIQPKQRTVKIQLKILDKPSFLEWVKEKFF